MKKTISKLLAVFLTLIMCMSALPLVFAADVANATIDMDAKCSLTIWKFDFTNAKKDGVWNENSFLSTGWRESYVETTLGEAVRTGAESSSAALGNGQHSNGYAIKGVEFTILRVADIVTFSESANDAHPDYNLTQVLYGFDKVKAANLMQAIGLENGKDRYANADSLNSNNWYYQSDVLNKALATSLAANATTVKNALEAYIAGDTNSIAMPITNEDGKTLQNNLPVGLYLVVETKVPEMVTNTTNPFFVSLPMTTVDGNDNSASRDGGHRWNYNVAVYPKNETGLVTLEKTVRESKADTATHNGSATDITDGYSHNATGSAGDVMEYQIISTLPTITSSATYLTHYNFYDNLSAGLSYNKTAKDVLIEIFTDKACTEANKVASWNMDSGMFTVSYSSDDRYMTVDLTAQGLAAVNGTTANANGALYAGYSNYTVRVTYTATINSNTTFVLGDEGNCNKVVLTWKRTSSDYYDTLIDDCHVYSYGIDLTKLFSDVEAQQAETKGMYQHVKFKIWNDTDKYWVTATRNDSEGIYYVTGHVANETDATIFYPVTSGTSYGKVIIQGLENDKYVMTEIETANGYTLLKDSISIDITAALDTTKTCNIYAEDILGVMQNDTRYNFDGGLDLSLANIPQAQLSHNLMTASATVDGNSVTMTADETSAKAFVPFTVVNTKGFDLPPTGDTGTWFISMLGVILMAGALFVVIKVKRKGEDNQTSKV